MTFRERSLSNDTDSFLDSIQSLKKHYIHKETLFDFITYLISIDRTTITFNIKLVNNILSTSIDKVSKNKTPKQVITFKGLSKRLYQFEDGEYVLSLIRGHNIPPLKRGTTFYHISLYDGKDTHIPDVTLELPTHIEVVTHVIRIYKGKFYYFIY